MNKLCPLGPAGVGRIVNLFFGPACFPSCNYTKSALTHHPQAGGGTACGSRALSEGRPAGRPLPAQYGQASRRHRRLVHRAGLRRCTGSLGAVDPQQAAPGIYRRIACYNGDTPPKKGGRSPYAAAHTQATMGGNRTDEALLELSTLVLANCQPALPLRRSICAG